MPSPTFRKWAWLGPLLTCKNVALLESMSMLSMSILSIDIDNIDTKGPSLLGRVARREPPGFVGLVLRTG
jgi:hypothetical protein